MAPFVYIINCLSIKRYIRGQLNVLKVFAKFLVSSDNRQTLELNLLNGSRIVFFAVDFPLRKLAYVIYILFLEKGTSKLRSGKGAIRTLNIEHFL